MRRLLATLLTASVMVILAGCGKTYETRLEASLDRMRYHQRLDANLQSPAGDAFQSLGIYLRPPKPLRPAPAPSLQAEPEQFDLATTFLDVPGDQGKSKKAARALRLHVLARSKQARPAAKKGEEAPVEVEREEFQPYVLDVLARDLGGLDPATAGELTKSDKQRSNEYRRLIFNDANEDLVRVYFFNQDGYEVALIWEIPRGQENTPAVSAGIPLALESMSVGARAQAAFQGRDVEEEGAIVEGAPGPAAPAQAF